MKFKKYAFIQAYSRLAHLANPERERRADVTHKSARDQVPACGQDSGFVNKHLMRNSKVRLFSGVLLLKARAIRRGRDTKRGVKGARKLRRVAKADLQCDARRALC